jgi:hypothetical protein
MRVTQLPPKENRERDLVSPVVVRKVREKRLREKDTSPAGVNRGAGLITGAHPCLPIEPLPFVGNLVRQRLLPLVVDGTDGDPAAGDTIILPPDGTIIRCQPAGYGQKTCFLKGSGSAVACCLV